ncbi:Mitochondrial fission regulator 2 [Orchesella cincta]|uniref:Mitochondrial fission regulator 2 n=1 Tax=Orchesella cincta TaxID=48709 RepID=A0A1D2MVP5_ORCCI|nr:Mitochondrial fission regulator 2 [Orchesella cincta]
MAFQRNAKNKRVEVFEQPVYDVIHRVEEVRLSPLVEVAIVGGLGVLIISGPAIASFVKRKFQVLTTRLVILKDRLCQAKLAKKLEALNRRRKMGSIVRVVGSLLPNSLFTPPCRIFIPNWAQLKSNQQWQSQPQNNLIGLEFATKLDPPSENLVGDGLIEAFEVASEVISSISGDEDDEETASSSPEGWAQEQREFPTNFNPTLNITDSSFARCSTPKGTRPALHFNATQASQCGSEENLEVSRLRKMVELTTHLLQLGRRHPLLHRRHTTPPMSLEGSRPLLIVKKGNQNQLVDKKPQASLSDVLKELPNAKLRRVERSPGGTPIKPQLKLAPDNLDIRSQLESALRKRFESMHSPMGEAEDKENIDDSEDSFEDNPVSAKRTLFPTARSPAPRRRSSGNQSSSENGTPPFGQHLLKRRNIQASDGEPLPLAVAVLRQQN